MQKAALPTPFMVWEAPLTILTHKVDLKSGRQSQIEILAEDAGGQALDCAEQAGVSVAEEVAYEFNTLAESGAQCGNDGIDHDVISLQVDVSPPCDELVPSSIHDVHWNAQHEPARTLPDSQHKTRSATVGSPWS